MTTLPKRGRGMALIAVLWLVAAMGLIISGVVRAVRSEAQNAGLQRHVAVSSAMADAMILLALQSLNVQPQARDAIEGVSVSFQGQQARVKVLPLNGMIDINHASPNLLADLYRYVGELNAESALFLAQATVEVRQTKNSKGLEIGFDAPEDLFGVPGFTYDLYAKINSLVTADLTRGSGRINPKFAPYGVLLVLSGGNATRANTAWNQRNADSATMDTSFFTPEFIEMTPANSVRLQALLSLPDNRTLLQKEWLVSMAVDPRFGLPWRVLRTSQNVFPASQAER